jgi:peptidoglycan-associated lipoprotein
MKYFLIASAAIVLTACASEPKETAETASGGATVTSSNDSVQNLPNLPTQSPSQEWLVANVGDRVFFDYDQSDLTREALDTVGQVATWMQKHPNVTLTLEGHADERGTREYNLALGERRATSVRSYMEALGVDGSRLSVISYGYERPAVQGSTEWSWAQNRRAVFTVNSSPRTNVSSAPSQ